MAGTVIADKWQNGDGTENYKCKAWVNFNGTGTVAIRASGNVSSITDSGVGMYRVNFTISMPDANYAAVVGASAVGVANAFFVEVQNGSSGQTNTSCDIRCQNGGGVSLDLPYLELAFFR